MTFLSAQNPDLAEQNSLKIEDVKEAVEKELLMKPEIFQQMLREHTEIFKEHVAAVVGSEFPNTLTLEDKLKVVDKIQDDTKSLQQKIQDRIELRFNGLLADTKVQMGSMEEKIEIMQAKVARNVSDGQITREYAVDQCAEMLGQIEGFRERLAQEQKASIDVVRSIELSLCLTMSLVSKRKIGYNYEVWTSQELLS